MSEIPQDVPDTNDGKCGCNRNPDDCDNGIDCTDCRHYAADMTIQADNGYTGEPFVTGLTADDPDTNVEGMSREEAIKILRAYCSPNGVGFPDVKRAITVILEQPPDDSWETYSSRLWKAAYEKGKADAMRKGEWIENGTGVFVTCNRCGRRNIKENFCPSCGADMRGEEWDISIVEGL